MWVAFYSRETNVNNRLAWPSFEIENKISLVSPQGLAEESAILSIPVVTMANEACAFLVVLAIKT